MIYWRFKLVKIICGLIYWVIDRRKNKVISGIYGWYFSRVSWYLSREGRKKLKAYLWKRYDIKSQWGFLKGKLMN